MFQDTETPPPPPSSSSSLLSPLLLVKGYGDNENDDEKENESTISSSPQGNNNNNNNKTTSKTLLFPSAVMLMLLIATVAFLLDPSILFSKSGDDDNDATIISIINDNIININHLEHVHHGQHHEQHNQEDTPTTPPPKTTISPLKHGQIINKLDAIIDDPNVLNVHVVPHTHDDVGWLKTVEQYYNGDNMTIQDACVRDIIDTMIDALLESPHRTFTYVEQKFFSMWWDTQNDATKDAVRYLIANQQLFFVNGGWCMHDEASTHFIGMIDQTTLGHDFLKKELGVIPKVGWQLDPFGHSATQGSLLTAQLGFDALYFGRIDYQDLDIRHQTQECEGLWAASKVKGDKEAVFWGLTGSYSGNYGPPEGFCFDDRRCHPVELVTNMTRRELIQRVDLFLSEIKVQADRTKGNHIMLTMGSDFNYQRASTYFDNIDLLMSSIATFQQWHLVNVTSALAPRFQEINIFYSSPEYYTEMKYHETNRATKILRQSNPNDKSKDQPNFLPTIRQTRETSNKKVDWKIKKDDFFPYSDCPHCFWTGYFTSRTAFKRLERVGSSFLLAARQIQAMPEPASVNIGAADSMEDECSCSSRRCHCNQPLYALEDALGVAQHHDGVSGTAKQHVVNDYSKRVQAGINEAADFTANKLKRLLAKEAGGAKILDDLTYCQLINETICDVSQKTTERDGFDMFVVVYNALGSNHSSVIHLPVSTDKPFDIKRLGTNPITTIRAAYPVFSSFQSSMSTLSAKYILSFDTGPLQPVGATVFQITPASIVEEGTHLTEEVDTEGLDVVTASNALVSAGFDRSTGALMSITADNVALHVSQSWGYYTSFDATMDQSGDNTARAQQNSGAYIFRPSTPGQKLKTIDYLQRGAKFFKRKWGWEVQAQFKEPWIQQTTRVLNNASYIEVEYTIGPIPIGDGRGKEIVTRLVTPIQSDATFFTDSNGREFFERKRDHRPSWPIEVFEPVSGNYYPINAAIYIEDENASLAVLTDRTQGGGSILDGSVELMAQRRLLADDQRGVKEPLNETAGGVNPYPPYGDATRYGEGMVVRGNYRIMVGKGKSGASLARSEMDRAFSSPLIFVASAPSAGSAPPIKATHSGLMGHLPPNVMLVTFKKLDRPKYYLVRLAHQYGVGEDAKLSRNVTLDLAFLFPGFKLANATEYTLSANRKWNDWQHKRFDWTGLGPLPKSPISDDNTIFTLQPMEVRTFVLKMEAK